MDRRGFLKMFGAATGGVIATATMAEAGMLAEFMSWLKRAPAWSFPSPKQFLELSREPLWNEIDAASLESVRRNITISEYFAPSPVLSAFRASFNGGVDIRPGFFAQTVTVKESYHYSESLEWPDVILGE